MKNILFRADSSSAIGIGHIMRDLVLAKQYVNDNIIFAVQNLEGNINRKIEKAGYKIELLKSNSIREVSNIIKKHAVDMIIIDSYNIDYNYEKQLKTENPNLKIIVFDDLYQKHNCDILLNHNIYAEKGKYKNLVPENCELRCGSKYTLLRDEFICEKKKEHKKDKNCKTVFIAMGGTDHSNINIKILEVLKEFKNIKVNLVTTSVNKNLDKLKTYVQNKKWIQLFIDSNNVAQLMRKSDFAIVTPSVTLNEVYYMEIPFITVKTADNQEEMYEYLKKGDCPVLKAFDKQKLEKKITIMTEELNYEK